jgi:hypothetical protein
LLAYLIERRTETPPLRVGRVERGATELQLSILDLGRELGKKVIQAELPSSWRLSGGTMCRMSRP